MPEALPPLSEQMQQAALDLLLEVGESPDDAAIRRKVEDWLESDPRHARAWDRAQRAWALAGRVPPPRTGPRRRMAAVAVAAVLVLAVAWVRAGHGDLHTAVGEIAASRLDDGSEVVLDGGSDLDVAAGEGGRDVTLLAGAAYFQVVPDAGRPFRVHAGEVTVSVLGTAFDVRLEREAVTVAVASGEVEVDSSGGNRRLRLHPGQQASVERLGGAVAVAAIDHGAVAAWRDGRLVVQDVSLSQVVEILERHHRGRLFIADAALARRRVTGVFDLSDPVAALRLAIAPHGGRMWAWGRLAVVWGA